MSVARNAARHDRQPGAGLLHGRRRHGSLWPRAAVTATTRETDAEAHLRSRAGLSRQCIMACRKGGTVSMPGVYGGFVDKVPIGRFMNKGLTLKTGQTHMMRYMKPLLERIEQGEIDPSFVISHALPIDEAPTRTRCSATSRTTAPRSCSIPGRNRKPRRTIRKGSPVGDGRAFPLAWNSSVSAPACREICAVRTKTRALLPADWVLLSPAPTSPARAPLTCSRRAKTAREQRSFSRVSRMSLESTLGNGHFNFVSAQRDLGSARALISCKPSMISAKMSL